MVLRLPCSSTCQGLSEVASESHRQGRRSDLITPDDITYARLHSYAFRAHIIGSFFAVGGSFTVLLVA